MEQEQIGAHPLECKHAEVRIHMDQQTPDLAMLTAREFPCNLPQCLGVHCLNTTDYLDAFASDSTR